MFERVKHGVLFALSLAAFLVQAWPQHAQACSCLATSFEQARADSAAIFEGRVVGLETDGADTVVHFRVTQAWRGVAHEEIVVRMPTSSAACAYPFQEGVVYLVYAQAAEDGLHTSLCSRTAAMDDEAAEADRQALGSGTIPVDVEDTEVTVPPARHVSNAGCASCTAQRAHVTSTQAVFALLALGLAARRSVRARG
jgi:hypothetical protein